MRTAARYSENARQALHLALGSLAFLLPFAAWWEAAILVGIVLASVLYVVPRIGPVAVYRDSERRRRYLSGVALHPLVILLLIFLLPDRRDIVAAAWVILAAGDSMATLVGTRAGGPRIPWNTDKSVAGSIAFVVAGGAAGVALCWWCRPVIVPPPYVWFSIAGPILAALAAAAVETIPVRLDDNISVPATAAAVLWWLSLVSSDAFTAINRAALVRLAIAVGVNAAAAGAGYAARTLTPGGAICGAGLGAAVLMTAGWSGWGLLMATFAMAVLTSRYGVGRKARLGIAEERGGRRAAGNAFANTGVAAASAVLAAVSYATGPALIALVAALAAGGSDTMASEIGKARGGRVFLFPTFRRVAAGTPGGISMAGTAAGLLGALLLGGLGFLIGLIPAGALLPVIAGATAGAFVESALASSLEGPGILNNDILNFLNTAVAAAIAVLISKAIQG